MNKVDEKKLHQPLEGEGSYSATRRYNKHLGDAVASGDLEEGAERARRAVEGPEGPQLKRAAEQAKRGPKAASATRDSAQVKPRK